MRTFMRTHSPLPHTLSLLPSMQSREASVADGFSYVMHGTIYHVEDKEGQVSIYVSFGGLLLKIKGTRSSLVKPGLELDQKVYLLLRK